MISYEERYRPIPLLRVEEVCCKKKTPQYIPQQFLQAQTDNINRNQSEIRDTNLMPAEMLMDFISHYRQLASLLSLATDCFAVEASFLLCLLLGIARKRKKTSMHVTSNISQIISGMPMPDKE